MNTPRPVRRPITDEARPDSDVSNEVAAVAASLVRPYDVVGIAVDILTGATQVAGATAGGLILRRLGQDRLQLLAATSHRAQELELYQAQHRQGPCFEAVETGVQVIAVGGQEIAVRWPDVAEAFRRGEVHSVHAVPLRWHGEVIGALNLFFAAEASPTNADVQVFADLATVAIVHSAPLTATQVMARTRSALDERTIIEQAKGVLAQQHHLAMDAAYELLLATARDNNELLTVTAAAVVAVAGTRPPS